MRNIVSIIKFDIKSKKIQLIIEFAVILFFIIRRLILGGRVPSDVTFIPVISVVLIINFIISIGKFLKSISIEEGRLLFLTPIKGWELICAKYLEFIGLGLLLILFTSIGNMIIGGDSKLIIITSLSILLGVFILFILITSLIVIFKSYISNTGTCVILTIISMWIIAILIVLLKIISYFIFPPIYMVIGEILEMNLFDILINIIIFGGLIFLSVYHIDKKLDIV